MSKKIAAAAVILVVFGGITIPGGIVVNNYIQNLVASSIDEGLLGIQREGIPLTEDMVNETFIATAINMSVYGITSPIPAVGLGDGAFFNDTLAYWELLATPVIRGIANYTNLVSSTGNLNYTAVARDRLLKGDVTLKIPGLVTDLDLGTGVSDFLDMYDAASNNPSLKNQMVSNYNCTWDLLTYLVNWMRIYTPADVLPLLAQIAFLLRPELTGLTTTIDIAKFYFLSQWCNGTLLPDGFPLPLKAGVRYGFEIGYRSNGPIIPTNMSIESARSLWNVSNPYSLVNKEGQANWWNIGPKHSVHYNATRDANFLEDGAVDLILAWLPKFRDNVMPFLAQEEYGLPTDTTTLGAMIQIGGIAIGGLSIGLAAAGFTGNIITKRKRLEKKQMGTIDKSKLADKGDSEQKYL